MTNNRSKAVNKRNRGVALIITLLLLSLITVLTLSMVIATTSDTLIDGYYRNARGSFYAADSGINAVRQYMINQMSSDVPSPFTTFSSPISSANESAIMTAIGNSSSGFGSFRSFLGSQTGSWPGSFKVNYDSTCATTGGTTCPTYMTLPANCTVHYTSSAGTLPTCYAAGNGTATWYQLSYPYKITVTGQSSSGELNTIEEQGTLFLTVTINTSTNTKTNFAAWGMFIDQSAICNGGTLVGGTITGPVFTNGAWNFGTTPVGYIFTDPVGSANANAGYQFGSCYQSPASQYTSGSQTIKPNFKSGFNPNQPAIPLPTDSYNQKEAVIDSLGNGLVTSSNMQAEMHSILKDVSGTAYPSSGTPSSGVFLPYYMNGSTPTFGSAPNVLPASGTTGSTTVLNPYGTNPGCGGGILVEGSAQVTVTAGSTATAQVYTIKQSSTTTTVTVDTSANTTTIVSGSSSKTVTGIPNQCDPGSGAVTKPGTMLYVDGAITALQGGGQGVASIQDSTALDIVANGSITITGDLIYKSEPVTLTQSGSTPADTLIPANNHGQALGIFTANGNINLANSQANGNLEIDASVATIASGGSGGLVNTGSAINTLTIVGGRIQNTIQNINTTTRNVWFDRRYAQGGFSPPWFPSTTVTASTTFTSPVPVVTANRISWVNTSAQ
jgi:Tfp pilus assembly protein PilX